ncbi:MAG: hypothetical protein WCQ66_04965 [Sphaerochaetaceae bacterium]
MQAVFETVFDIAYLSFVLATGIRMLAQGKKIGMCAVILGGGDAFHLIPRAVALWTDGLAAHSASLGIGELITSITMTVFYLLLYRYTIRDVGKETKSFAITLYVLAILRISLCLFPQNRWTSADAPFSWGVFRNIPFVIMGIMMIVLYARRGKSRMALAVALSFGFYIPVVLFAGAHPFVGMLMIPKTLSYVWIIVMLSKTK